MGQKEETIMAKKIQKVENGKVLVLSAKMTVDAMLARAKQEWIARYVRPDGSLANNRYAPIYARLDDESNTRILFLYGDGALQLFRGAESIPVTTKMVVS
jgi:hypothetical protein